MSCLFARANVLKCSVILVQSRQELEQHSVDTASTSDAVTFITYVQALKRKIKQFEKQVDVSTIYLLQRLNPLVMFGHFSFLSNFFFFGGVT